MFSKNIYSNQIINSIITVQPLKGSGLVNYTAKIVDTANKSNANGDVYQKMYDGYRWKRIEINYSYFSSHNLKPAKQHITFETPEQETKYRDGVAKIMSRYPWLKKAKS